MRKALQDVSPVMPMARKTWLGSGEWLEQALPPATQMPSWSKRSTMVSLSHSSARPWMMLGRKSQLPHPPPPWAGCRQWRLWPRRGGRAGRRRRGLLRLGLLGCLQGSDEAGDAGDVLGRCGDGFLTAAQEVREEGVRAFRYRAPAALGPPILWAEKEAASTPSFCTSSGILPRACTASVWKRRRARGPIWLARGWAGWRPPRNWPLAPRRAPCRR